MLPVLVACLGDHREFLLMLEAGEGEATVGMACSISGGVGKRKGRL